jgi:serine/threonine protein kinase
VKLSDFGLARARDRAASMTAPGTVKGKLAYLAPEVTFGKPTSPQSDLFSACVVMWEALTQTRLFDGKTDLEVFKSIRACQPPPVGNFRQDVPDAVLVALRKGLAADPEQRFASANDLANELAQALTKSSNVDVTKELATIVAQLKAGGSHGKNAADFDSGGITQAIDIEFSDPDLSVAPLELNRKK